MKRLLFGVLITLTLTGLVFAQRGTPPNPLRGLQNALNLTESQIDSVKTLMQLDMEKIPELMGGLGKGIRSFRKAMNEPDSADLPPEQREEIDKKP